MSLIDGKKQWVEWVFQGREALDERELWKRYFQQHGVAMETVAKVRRILSEVLETDLARIRDTDDFSKQLKFFWEFDSVADMTILVALEHEFGIVITDAEAERMKQLKDIVLGVHAKLQSPRIRRRPAL